MPKDLAKELRGLGIRATDIVVYTNSHCNLRCRHCYLGNELLGYRNELEARSVGAALAKFGPLERLTLLGGEILLYSQAVDLLKAIQSLDVRERRLTTNLTVWRAAVISAALAAGIRLCVSLDGSTSQSHDLIRGEGTFAKTTKNLARLADLDADVEITHTVMRSNYRSFPLMLELCRELGIRRLNLHLISLQGNALENSELELAPTEWRELVSYIEDRASSRSKVGLMVRYPLRFANHEEFLRLIAEGQYHHHAQGSFYSSRGGQRVVIYADGRIYISSEAFGTESFVGDIQKGLFRYNPAPLNELVIFSGAQLNGLTIADMNPSIRGDSNFPIPLSVSFKRVVEV